MIKVSPEIEITFECPNCAKPIHPSEWLISGMHTLCYGKCEVCQDEFYMEMPINSGLFYPGIIQKKTGLRRDKIPFDNWYLSGLESAFKKKVRTEIGFTVEKIRKIEKKPCILNTIDATYGHALYELFNASYYLKQEDIDLIIVVQKNMRWLVPSGAAEIWIVDIPFSKANDWNDWLAQKIQEQVADLKEVFLCRSFVQADSNDFDIEDYSGVKPFPLDQWDERLEKPTVTFIWRTDRFWKRVLPKVIDNRISRRLFPTILEAIRNKIQFKWIIEFSRQLRQQIPGVDFAIAGMDNRKQTLPGWIKDYRYDTHSDKAAVEQCQRYAQSHLVVGCNGSSLLLPGCHAGSVIDIVPGDQWAVSAGTFPFRITTIGDTHFRYLMTPAEITKKRLINIIISMLRDRSYILLQTSPPWREHQNNLHYYAWSKFRIDAFNLSRHFKPTSGMISVPKNNS